jgi:hypothetical protein
VVGAVSAEVWEGPAFYQSRTTPRFAPEDPGAGVLDALRPVPWERPAGQRALHAVQAEEARLLARLQQRGAIEEEAPEVVIRSAPAGARPSAPGVEEDATGRGSQGEEVASERIAVH